MSLVMIKPAFCICKNKDADQLRGNREADQRPRGGTLIFSEYIGSAPASTAYPQKIHSLTDYPKKIPGISGIPQKIIEILAYPPKIITFFINVLINVLCIGINFIPEHNDAVRSRQ